MSRPHRRRFVVPVVAAFGLAACIASAACAPDSGHSHQRADAGRAGDRPVAHRIITLAPHLAELSFAAGAGDALVGTVAWSDYPEAARQIPRVGDAFRVDFERIAGLQPDLILVWPTGNPPEITARLRALGFTVLELDARTLDDIGVQIRTIGQFAGTGKPASDAADKYTDDLASLRARYADAARLRVFYQISRQPLMTIGEGHFISQAMTVCGGGNVFGETDVAAFAVDVEAVIAAAPDVIIAGQPNAADWSSTPPDQLAVWRRWSAVPAVANGQLHVVDAGLLTVPGPRLPVAIATLCRLLDEARKPSRATATASDADAR